MLGPASLLSARKDDFLHLPRLKGRIRPRRLGEWQAMGDETLEIVLVFLQDCECLLSCQSLKKSIVGTCRT